MRLKSVRLCAAGSRDGTCSLFDAILSHVPPPTGDPRATLQFLVTNLDYSDYVGRLAVGRVFEGTLRAAETVSLCGIGGAARKVKVALLTGTKG